MSNDIDKHLADAMGDDAPAPKSTSTSKQTLRTPAVVPAPAAAAAPEPVAVPVEPSKAEMYLQMKLDIMKELLAEERALRGTGKRLEKDLGLAAEDKEPEETVRFRVHLPAQADKIRVDGREYYHGFTYDIPLRQAASMRDIQANSWRHDDQVRGFTPHSRGSSTSGIQIDGNGNVLTNPAAGF